MRAMLLTVLLVAGVQLSPLEAQQPLAVAGEGCTCAECSQCSCGSGCGTSTVLMGCLRAWMSPMPQTCYAPRYGCYPGNDRHMNRYPAFHGTYYREAYNYRQLFDYPWHATPYEPLGYFLTYQDGTPTTAEEQIPTLYPQPDALLPEPLPLVPGDR